jgi:hypothetical protein
MILIEQADLDSAMCIKPATSLSQHEIDALVVNNKILADSSTHGILVEAANECGDRDRVAVVFHIERMRSKHRNFCFVPAKSTKERLFLQRIDFDPPSFERVLIIDFETLPETK